MVPEDGTAHEGRQPVLVSACLLGRACRYDGRDNQDRELARELAQGGFEPVPFCPEEEGGLGTPRPAAWLEGQASGVAGGQGRVVTEDGRDVTEAFLKGARRALELCRARGIRRAFLKERSPSCGVCRTHVAGRLVEGPGVTTEILRAGGVEVSGVEGRRD